MPYVGGMILPQGDSGSQNRGIGIALNVPRWPQPGQFDTEELVLEMVETLESSPFHQLNRLPDLEACAGCYAIYYRGGLSLYAPIWDSGIPIYLGKAEPPGGRQGLASAMGDPLANRLRQHRRSLDATDLDVEQFCARLLIVEPMFVEVVERALIDYYKPLWNTEVDGFGNNDPGQGRARQKRSDWDVLHPGRPYSNRDVPGRSTSTEIEHRIRRFLKNHPNIDT